MRGLCSRTGGKCLEEFQPYQCGRLRSAFDLLGELSSNDLKRVGYYKHYSCLRIPLK